MNIYLTPKCPECKEDLEPIIYEAPILWECWNCFKKYDVEFKITEVKEE